MFLPDTDFTCFIFNRNTAQLIINVGDVNDNAPIFSQKRYEVRLQENKMDFDVPLIVEAHDLDLNGKNYTKIIYIYNYLAFRN